MLKIADLEFELEKKDFNAYISVGENGYALKWDLEILAKPQDIPVVNEEGYESEWQPFISTHAMLKNLPLLDTLANTEFTLADELDGEP